MFSFIFVFFPFPFGIVLLLKILKTQPVKEEPANTRGFLVARMVFTLQKLRYRLTLLSRLLETCMKVVLDENSHPALDEFCVCWVVGLPILFFFLLAATFLLLPLLTLLSFISFTFSVVFGIIACDAVAQGATHVPSFYSPSTKSDKYCRMIAFAIFGLVFGGVHGIAWNFTFPTPFEQHLWRATSLTITIIPFIVAPVDYILENLKLNEAFGKVVRLLLDLVMTILLFAYVPLRLSMIAQALALLRNQPESAFSTVDWSRYIPHVF